MYNLFKISNRLKFTLKMTFVKICIRLSKFPARRLMFIFVNTITDAKVKILNCFGITRDMNVHVIEQKMHNFKLQKAQTVTFSLLQCDIPQIDFGLC